MIRYAMLALGTLVLGTAAHGQQVRASDPQTLVAALQGSGYKASLSKDSSGDPKIESAASGATFVINFYGCTKNRDCKTVTFYSAWSGTSATTEQLNEWNREKRFSRAYIDKEGDPVIEYDLDLDDGGLSQPLFIDNIEFWELALGAFRKHIGV